MTCNAQIRTAGTPIGPIQFVANDADGDALSSAFAYQHDADPVQVGVPSLLTSSCLPGSGTLQCTIQGLASSTPRILTLTLTVSDGTASLPLDSLLEVLAPVDGRILADGFEVMGCR